MKFGERHGLKRCGTCGNCGARRHKVDLDSARGYVLIVCIHGLTSSFWSRIAVAGSTESRFRLAAASIVPNDGVADPIRFQHLASVFARSHSRNYVEGPLAVELCTTLTGSRMPDDHQVPIGMFGELRIEFFQQDALAAIVHSIFVRSEDYVVQPGHKYSRLDNRDGDHCLTRAAVNIANCTGYIDDFGLYARPVCIESHSRRIEFIRWGTFHGAFRSGASVRQTATVRILRGAVSGGFVVAEGTGAWRYPASNFTVDDLPPDRLMPTHRCGNALPREVAAESDEGEARGQNFNFCDGIFCASKEPVIAPIAPINSS